jgi:hypothetical protein
MTDCVTLRDCLHDAFHRLETWRAALRCAAHSVTMAADWSGLLLAMAPPRRLVDSEPARRDFVVEIES